MTKEILANGWRPHMLESPGHCDRPEPKLIDRLFQRMSLSPAQGAPGSAHVGSTRKPQFALAAGSQIALFAPDTAEFRRMKTDIEDLGGSATIIPETVLPQDWLREHAPRLAFCIVGHDFADADATVDFCLELRIVAPELVIVLALAGVPRSDLGSERMSICEVTLRRPVSCVSLSLGVQAAFDNRADFETVRDQGVSSGATLALPWETLVRQGPHQSSQ